MLRLFAVLAVSLTLLVAGATAGAAQDASPTGSPAAGPCDAPTLPPGTPTPMEEMGPPEGTPADETAGMEMGTPEASTTATPAPSPPPVGTPADAATADEAVEAAENFANCLNGGNFEGVAALLTERSLLELSGSANPYDAARAFEQTGAITYRSLGDAQTHDDGRVSLAVVYTFAALPNQLVDARWFFVADEGYLKIDEELPLPTAGADVAVDAAMVDYAFELSQDAFTAGQTIGFDIPNRGEYLHEFVVVRLPAGVTVEQALAGAVPEDQLRPVGVAFADPGGQTYLGLTDLEAGTYAVVCFVEEPGGVPHVARGMVAEFTVA